MAVIKVPDPRVDALAEIFKPKKKTYAEIEFIDIVPAMMDGADNVPGSRTRIGTRGARLENENMHPRSVPSACHRAGGRTR